MHIAGQGRCPKGDLRLLSEVWMVQIWRLLQACARGRRRRQFRRLPWHAPSSWPRPAICPTVRTAWGREFRPHAQRDTDAAHAAHPACTHALTSVEVSPQQTAKNGATAALRQSRKKQRCLKVLKKPDATITERKNARRDAPLRRELRAADKSTSRRGSRSCRCQIA